MKTLTKYAFLLALLAALLFPTVAFAGNPENTPLPDKIVFGGAFTLKSGETISGNLAVLGGTTTLEKGSTVTGDAVLLGGTLLVDGTISGSINALGGSLDLGSTAVVYGNVNTLGGALQRADGARIEGQITHNNTGPTVTVPPVQTRPLINLAPLGEALWFMFRTLATAALAMLLILFLPAPAERVAHAVVGQPVISGGLGLLTVIVAPILILIITITIILIPVSLLAIFILIIAVLFGWIALGLEVGNRIAALFKATWPAAVSAGVGTFLLTLVANGIGYIPCVGWIAPFLVGILGLGGVILTRFGTQLYPPTPYYSGGPVVPVTPRPMPPASPYTPVSPVVPPAPAPSPEPQPPAPEQPSGYAQEFPAEPPAPGEPPQE